MPSQKKKIVPPMEQNRNVPEFEVRCRSTPDEKKFEVVTWHVNNIRHLLKPPRGVHVLADGLTPLKHFIIDHGYPDVICLQDLRIHRSDEKVKDAIRDAVGAGGGQNYEVFFSLRGGAAEHLQYELREADGYVYKESPYQPKKEISGEWAGVCTLLRDDWSPCVKRDGTGQRQWDVQGRFLFLQLQTASWNMMIMNCFFPDVPRRAGMHSLAFQGPRTVDLDAAKQTGGDYFEHFIDTWMDERRDNYIPLNEMTLRNMGYEEEVIQEMGTVEKTCHEFRAELHERVLDEAKAYRNFRWHVLFIGSMNIMPQSWEHEAPKHRPTGYKAQGGHNAERLDFKRKFLDVSQPDNFRGMDAFNVMNLKDPFIHYAIVDRELGEEKDGLLTLLEAKVLDHVLNKEASYYHEHDDHVSKNVVFDLDRLIQSEADRSLSREYSEGEEDRLDASHGSENHATPSPFVEGSAMGNFHGMENQAGPSSSVAGSAMGSFYGMENQAGPSSSVEGSAMGSFHGMENQAGPSSSVGGSAMGPHIAEEYPLGPLDNIDPNIYAYDPEGWDNGMDPNAY